MRNIIISVLLFAIFFYTCVSIFTLSTFYYPAPEYVVYHIAEEYNMETDLILVESKDNEKIEITDKKIIYEILTKFNTVPSVKHNSEKFLFIFTYSRAPWSRSQTYLEEYQMKKTLIFNKDCKITIYGDGITYDYFSVEYNGKMNKYETVRKGFYADIMELVNDCN